MTQTPAAQPRTAGRVAALALLGLSTIAIPALSAPAAFADDDRGHRGRGGHDRDWDRGHGRDRDWDRDRGRDWDRGRDHDWDRGRRDYRRHHDDDRFSLSLNFGRPYYYSAPSYAYPAYPGYYANAYGLRPHECFTQLQWDRWRGRPAQISVRICADSYGASYIVQGSQRLVRY